MICYGCDGRLHSFNFSDFHNSIAKLLPFTPADFIGKRIRQRFMNDEENDIFWGQGIAISKDFDNSLDFIINLFGNENRMRVKLH